MGNSNLRSESRFGHFLRKKYFKTAIKRRTRVDMSSCWRRRVPFWTKISSGHDLEIRVFVFFGKFSEIFGRHWKNFRTELGVRPMCHSGRREHFLKKFFQGLKKKKKKKKKSGHQTLFFAGLAPAPPPLLTRGDTGRCWLACEAIGRLFWALERLQIGIWKDPFQMGLAGLQGAPRSRFWQSDCANPIFLAKSPGPESFVAFRRKL